MAATQRGDQVSRTWENSASQTGTYARSHLSGQNAVMGRIATPYLAPPSAPTKVVPPNTRRARGK